MATKNADIKKNPDSHPTKNLSSTYDVENSHICSIFYKTVYGMNAWFVHEALI